MTLLRPVSLAAVSAVLALSVTACGGNSDSSAGSAGGPAGNSAGSASPTAAVAYDGPESKVPASFTAPTAKSGFSFTVGWLSPNTANNALKTGAEAGEARAKELGGKFILLNAANDVDTQVSQCNQLVAQKADAIVVYAVDPNALGPCLKEAAADGIKVFGEDTPSHVGEDIPAYYTSSVSQGPDRAAYAAAAAAAKAHPGAKFATLGVAIPVPFLQYYTERLTYWAKRLGLSDVGNVNAQEDTSQDGATAMNTILTRWPDVKVVLSYNDPSAEAAATTARAAGNTDVAVYGLDAEDAALKMVKAGQLAGTVLVETKEEARQLVNGIYDALTNQNLPLPEQIALHPVAVTSANAGSVTPFGD